MSTLVECDTALDRHGNEIRILDAASGAKGYFCRSCGAEMVAHQKRRRNEAHFQHRPRFAGEVFDCIWSNETYRHKVAKKLIQQSRQLKLPALYALRPAGYNGPLPRILETALLVAPEVLVERCVYEDDQGRIRFARALEYDQDPAGKELLVRPDLIFRNARQEPILFVEICVTHTPDDRKLARLHRLQVPTVEIQILACHSENELAHFLTHTATSSRWLYHPQQYVYQPAPEGSLSAGRRSGAPTSNKRRLFGVESLKCRTIRVEDALRGVRKHLAGPEHAARRAELAACHDKLRAEEDRITQLFTEHQRQYQTEQATSSREVAELDAQLRTAHRAVNPEVQRRVAERRSEAEAATAALERERSNLRRAFEDAQRAAHHEFNAATTELRDQEAAADAIFDRAEAELRNQYAECDELIRMAAELDAEEAKLNNWEGLAQEGLERARQALYQLKRITEESMSTGKVPDSR